MAAKFVEGPTMDSIPTEATQETAPKRRRGRPPRDPSAPKRTYTRRTPDLKSSIGAMLVTMNIPLMAFPPTRDDALDAREIELLTDAIDNQCKLSPTFRRYVVAATTATQGGQLISVTAIIAMRRLARHGILPRETDAAFGAIIGSTTISHAPDTNGYAADAADATATDTTVTS